MSKLTITLTAQDIKIMVAVLGHMLTSKDVKDLKSTLHVDYLLFSCVHDFFNRMHTKHLEINAFGLAPGKRVKMHFKRHEAIAFFFLCSDHDDEGETTYLPALPDPTMSLINSIIGEIHKAFLV